MVPMRARYVPLLEVFHSMILPGCSISMSVNAVLMVRLMMMQ
jgi:hypothetical protein